MKPDQNCAIIGTNVSAVLAMLVQEARQGGTWVDWPEATDLIDDSDNIVAREADVLAISDLPAQLTSDQINNLFWIIDHRYSHCRPTWVALNVTSRREAEELLGEMTVDRLWHDALVIDPNSTRKEQA